MKHAKISELKSRLSYFLRFVRRGQSVLVYDRDRVIARIEPVRATTTGDAAGGHLEDLQQQGVLRAPEAALPDDWLSRRPDTNVDVVAALLDGRESGR